MKSKFDFKLILIKLTGEMNKIRIFETYEIILSSLIIELNKLL